MIRKFGSCIAASSLALGFATSTFAQTALIKAPDAAHQALMINKGDTAWLLLSSALVLMMSVPGLALFYGGLVRSKNVLSTMMHSLILMALISARKREKKRA